MAKIQTKSISLNMRTWSGRRKLNALLRKGWSIASERQHSALEWFPNNTDYTLTRGA